MAFKLRKRVILTVFLTIGFLISTNSLWLVRKPIRTELDITGAQNAKVEVQLNRKDNNDFIKINQARVKINNDSEHLIIKNRTSKKAKRFRLNITDLEIGKTFEIKNINLHFNKCKLNELDKFIIKGANFEIKGNALIITPKSNNVTILYDKSINEKAPKKFEFELFIIILILSSLLGYKLLDYVADFSSIEHKSRVDIVFLCIFFTMLFIPMSHINQDNKSTTENRMLAKWKPLVNKDGSLNYNFGKDYETWYNDRFNGRNFLLNIYRDLKYSLAINSYENGDNFINKNGNWILHKNPLQKRLLTYSEKEQMLKSLESLKKYSSQNNFKFYIILAPSKTEIYNGKECYPCIVNKKNHLVTLEDINDIEKKSGIKIIYPYQELKEASKRDYVFYKTDTHWTDSGAYQAYLLLMKQVQKDFPNIKISEEEDFDYKYSNLVRVNPKSGFHIGNLPRTLNLKNERILNTTYKHFTLKGFNPDLLEHSTQSKNKLHGDIYKYSNKNEQPNLFLYGDSFTLNILNVITNSFNNTFNSYVYVNSGESKNCFRLKYFDKEIKENKTDVLVICFCELDRVGYLFEE